MYTNSLDNILKAFKLNVQYGTEGVYCLTTHSLFKEIRNIFHSHTRTHLILHIVVISILYFLPKIHLYFKLKTDLIKFQFGFNLFLSAVRRDKISIVNFHEYFNINFDFGRRIFVQAVSKHRLFYCVQSQAFLAVFSR